jgi:hypothetical protein
MSDFKKNIRHNSTGPILLTGLVSGTLDILGAIITYCFIYKVITPAKLLRGIAAGVFGKRIVGSETVMELMGLSFHYMIALTFATVYFIIFPYIPLMGKHKIISGLLYGIFVWIIMTWIVLPFSNVQHYPFKPENALIAVALLVLCIGLPISLITSRYYRTADGHLS